MTSDHDDHEPRSQRDDQEHRDIREAIGAYVLGQLGEQHRRTVEAHLDTCDACRAEYAELVPVAAALSDVREGRRTTGPATLDVPADLDQRVLAAVTAEERRTNRRRWSRVAALTGVAAASAVIALLVGIRAIGGDPEPPRVPLEAVAITERAPQVSASADLVAHTWGVEVKLRATGFERGERYVVTVLGKSGRAYPAGEFLGTGAQEMSCNLNSSVVRQQADGFVVRDLAGDVVVASRF